MLDNEIKKLLTELKMDDLIDTLEGNTKPEEVLEAPAASNEEPQKELPPEVPQDSVPPKVLQEQVLKDPEVLQETPPEMPQDEGYEQNTPIFNPEPQYHETTSPVSYFSGTKVLLAIACVALAPASYMLWQMPEDGEDDPHSNPNSNPSSYVAYNDTEEEEDEPQQQAPEEEEVQPQPSLQQEREAAAASWAREIVDINVEDGKSVHQLWDMLRRRREDLDGVAKELTQLLSDNARFRQDFYSQTASVLLSRYQAIDARHSVEIANQINAIYAQIKEEQDPDLTRAYAEMLGELGAESYSTHQIQIAKEILHQESMCQKALMNIGTSNSLSSLEYNLRLANQVIKAAQTNGLMQTFHSGQEYQDMISKKCLETLGELLVEENEEAYNKEDRALLEHMLNQVGANERDSKKFTERFDKLTKPKEVEPTSIRANC